MAKHDTSYKELFSHPEMVADLIRGFVREEWVAQLDFSTLGAPASSRRSCRWFSIMAWGPGGPPWTSPS